jgi:hypothetical protein
MNSFVQKIILILNQIKMSFCVESVKSLDQQNSANNLSLESRAQPYINYYSVPRIQCVAKRMVKKFKFKSKSYSLKGMETQLNQIAIDQNNRNCQTLSKGIPYSEVMEICDEVDSPSKVKSFFDLDWIPLSTVGTKTYEKIPKPQQSRETN